MSVAETSSSSAPLLRLPAVRRMGAALAQEAQRQQLSYEEFLAKVLLCEVDERDERRRLRRVKSAGFPRVKLLEEFDLAASGVNPR